MLIVNRQPQFCAGMSWSSATGVKACAHLLRQALTAQPGSFAGPAITTGINPTVRVCWAWCLQQAACEVLSLQHRSLDLERLERATAGTSGTMTSFIGLWCTVLDQLLEDASSAEGLTDDSRASMVDLFDGRLWHFMFHCVSADKPTGLSLQTLQTAKDMMHAICQAVGVAEADMLAGQPPIPGSAADDFASHYVPAQHRIQGNAFIDAFLGPQRGPQQVDDEAPAAEELRTFDDNYHWHTGRPIEPSYIGETHEANLLAQYAGADIYTMVHCPLLRFGQRAMLQQIINQETDPLLWHKDPAERLRRLATYAQIAHGWARSNLDTQSQRQARFMRNYADTLSSTRYCMPPAAGGRGGRGAAHARGGRGAGRGRGGGRAQAIIQANTVRLIAESERSRAEAWRRIQSDLDQHAEVHDCWDSYMILSVYNFLEDCKEKPTSAETFLAASCYQLKGEVRAWKQQCYTSSTAYAAATAAPIAFVQGSSFSMLHAINIWKHVQSILSFGQLKLAVPGATTAALAAIKDAFKQCMQALQLLGFVEAAVLVQQLLAALGAPMRSRPATATGGNQAMYHVGMTEAEFQLSFCGDILERDVPATKDPRVQSFTPDKWQCDVLDAIDARASCVMCAPTSSGKTFISSYCIDRVMRESTDGVVVFVAPTKALVNQTAAQVSKATLCTCTILHHLPATHSPCVTNATLFVLLRSACRGAV